MAEQIAARGVSDPSVLRAMAAVAREKFVLNSTRPDAYHDGPLPIGENQTISQPYIVAWMAEAAQLKASDRVLDVGTGSGYAAAVLSEIASEVFSVERHESLAKESQERLIENGYTNVSIRCGDGSLGWPEEAPFDAILVAAASPDVPAALLEQLKVGGRLVIPIGERNDGQTLVRVERLSESNYKRESLGGVRFVPLIGEQGWER